MAVRSIEAGHDAVGAETGTMFLASSAVTLLDYFRLPYEIEPALAGGRLEQLRRGSDGPSLFWSTGSEEDAKMTKISPRKGHPEVPIFASVVPDTAAPGLLREVGRGWRPVRTLIDGDGRTSGAIWQSEDGSVFLPFDPAEVMVNYWSEKYAEIGDRARGRRMRRLMMTGYYRLRPLLPRPVQIWLRRQFARRHGRSSFPRWPIETGLHDFFDLMFAILADVAGEPVPRIASWPNGYDWALVLTHDVEKAKGLAAIDPVLDVERARGFRSSWNLVAGDYEVPLERVRKLARDGFEIGVHGMHHDGRDLESLRTWQERLPGIREAGELWGAVGFRAPSLHRRWEWMPQLGFDYDSSWPDADPFEPQDGGCCTWLPFFNGELVELPVTLTLDHTLFVILGQTDERAWVAKTEFLRERGGLALIDTHPDYLGDSTILSSYANFLGRFASDETAWKALPREVSSWWRRRSSSSLRRDGKAWRITGPAAGEGRVELVGGEW